MSSRNLRWLGFGLLVSAGAGLLTLTSVINASYALAQTADAAAEETIGLVMGPSGDPIPGPEYVEVANGLYITNPLSTSVLPFADTTYPGVLANGLFNPRICTRSPASGPCPSTCRCRKASRSSTTTSRPTSQPETTSPCSATPRAPSSPRWKCSSSTPPARPVPCPCSSC